ncbi:MAG: C45 family autoproteolytic acyltransferase/hydrolase [Thermoplasmata archaeon]
MAKDDGPKTLREVSASGSHYNIGVSLGKQCRDQALRTHKMFKARVERAPGMTLEKALARARLSLPLTKEFYPAFVEEAEGYADGTGADFDLVYATLCDGLLGPGKGCTDIAVNSQWTKDDVVLAAHSEDLEPFHYPDLCITRVTPKDEPGFISVGYGGIYPTVGMNSAGISLTGNALVQNDARQGMPKEVAVRKVLSARGLYDALTWSMPVSRGQSYNNIVCDDNGEIYSMEGSATAFDALYGHEGYLVHTNHYLSPKMWRFEDDLHTRMSSIIRYNRASKLFKRHLGQVDLSTFKDIFSDHVGHPESICRHPDPRLGEEDQTMTLFSAVFDLTRKALWVCAGNPCEGEYRKYEL